MSQRILIQLGRAGDIISLLPLLHLDAQSGKRSALMVSKQFAGILDGCSYVDPIIFDGDVREFPRAVEEAKKLSDQIVCTQLIGDPELVLKYSLEPAGKSRATRQSFVQEAWDIAGKYSEWKNQPPLIFDRRDKAREAELLKLLPKKKKIILLSTKGISSPFEHHELLRELLELKFGRSGYAVFDLATVQAERIYDLLALYEAAHCLVATDSAPLHLAYACKLPVVALVNDEPNLMKGSPWRANHIAHIRYGDFPKRALDVLRAIEGIGKPGCWFNTPDPLLVHAWSDYDSTEDGKLARKAWENIYARWNWVACPIGLGALGRDSKFSSLKDEKRFPFVKDVIELALLRAKDTTVIFLTRGNTHPGKDIAVEVLSKDPCYAHRAIRADGIDSYHPAIDLFAFTKKWWREHQAEYPNFLLGNDPHWHRVLMELMKKHGGVEIKGACYQLPSTPKPAVKYDKKPARLAYNETLFAQWMKANNISGMVPPVDKQVELLPVARRSLSPFGYNPSLIQFNGKLLMAYRWHLEGRNGTVLSMAELAIDGRVLANKRITLDVGNRSLEDPRLFIADNELWICFVDAVWPDKNPKCVTKFGKLVESPTEWNIIEVVQPKCGKNDGTALEKNFVFWYHATGLHSFLYKTQPDHAIYSFHGDEKITENIIPGPKWAYGAIKGGTTPVPFGEDKILRFFHSTLDNETGPSRRRYYIGAYVIDKTVPYKISAISKSPIIIGSESDDLTDTEKSSLHHHKAQVVFPAGCVKVGEEYWLSFGINDSSCAIAKLKESDLNL